MDVLSNLSISPSGSQVAFTAIRSFADIPGIREGYPFEDEDIFILHDLSRIPTRVETPYGFLFERRSRSGKSLKNIGDVMKIILTELPNNWRGRELEIADDKKLVFTDEGDINIYSDGSLRKITDSPRMESAPMIRGDTIYYHSAYKDDGSIHSIPLKGISTDRLVTTTNGESPYFVVGVLKQSN